MSRPPRLPPQPVVFLPGGLALGFLGPPDMLLFHLVSYVFMGVMGIPGYFFFRNPKNLQRCHVWVKALADRGEHSEAAGVAALMGKYGPAKTLKIAKGSFRGIGFGSLCETDFDDNAARWELSASTVKSRLGAVDAFLSHSWKDPAKPKWAAIRRWASKRASSLRWPGARSRRAPASSR